MKQFDLGGDLLLVVDRGEELHTQLNNWAQQSSCKSAWLTGLGGASGITLGYYDLAGKTYHWQTFDEELEILSLTGNLSIVDGQPFWHIHGTFGRADYSVIGGRIKELTIGLTGELHITPLAPDITREYDAATGLKLLCPLQ